MDATEAVGLANRRYYDAFETVDLDAMSAIWEHSDRVVCTHPGWSTLRGWGSVAASYFALFGNGSALQFVLTNEHTVIAGETGWVSVDENLLGDDTGVTVAALNVFVSAGDGWRMVAHHGSVVQVPPGA
ncbi:MAG: nuclear transport factor 2 family protein [Acidimicrobiales bacterium]